MMISLIEGGHSLLVIKLISKIKEKFGKEIKVSTLIKNPTLEGIACLIRDKHDMTKSVSAPGSTTRIREKTFLLCSSVYGKCILLHSTSKIT